MTYGCTLAKARNAFDIDPATSGSRLLLAALCVARDTPVRPAAACVLRRPPMPAALPLSFIRARRSTAAVTKAAREATIDRCALSDITNSL